eukprot:Clim_evm26s148 gene=Clim_evmTU26s148
MSFSQSQQRQLIPRILSAYENIPGGPPRDPDMALALTAQVVDHLRKSFPEYGRRPRKPFENMVSSTIDRMIGMNALDELFANLNEGIDENNDPGSASEDDETEIRAMEAATPKHNTLNQSLAKAYAAQNEQTQRRRKRQQKGTNALPSKRSRNDPDTASSGGHEYNASIPKVRLGDLGGVDDCIQDIRELIEYPMSHPEIYAHLGVSPPRGVLLHGPPGCGKTMLAHAIAGELQVPLLKISAPEIVSGMSGESEAKIRSLFQQAQEVAPCILFIDEIDAITPKRETAAREMERRIVAQLLTCMDTLGGNDNNKNDEDRDQDGNLSIAETTLKPVICIGATNRPDSLDPALRRAGRFDREISLGIPDEKARARILQVITKGLRLDGDFDYLSLARKTPGFVGADLNALAKEAAVLAINRIFGDILKREDEVPNNVDDTMADSNQMNGTMDVDGAAQGVSHVGESNAVGESVSNTSRDSNTRNAASVHLRMNKDPLPPEVLANLSITMQDFEAAIDKVQPSAQREGFATAPNVTWEDVGALDHVRDELRFAVLEPVRHPEKFEEAGISVPPGILLYGPPGCGKTLLAKAVAGETGMNFISIKGPELLNKYVGESERAIRLVFQRARTSAPCVIFFDELDSVCPKRGSSQDSNVTERVVNTLLTELDGLESRKGIFVIAATNRPDIIDPAMLRPGRLDKLLYVALPTKQERLHIFKTLTRKIPLDPTCNMQEIAEMPGLTGYSGADCAALVREAATLALRECIDHGLPSVLVQKKHFLAAVPKVLPSISDRDERMYMRMSQRLRRARGHLEPEDGSGSGKATNNPAPTNT